MFGATGGRLTTLLHPFGGTVPPHEWSGKDNDSLYADGQRVLSRTLVLMYLADWDGRDAGSAALL